jgi:hypothetical protein
VRKNVGLYTGKAQWIGTPAANPKLINQNYANGQAFIPLSFYPSPEFSFIYNNRLFIFDKESLTLNVVAARQVIQTFDLPFRDVLFFDAKSTGDEFLVHGILQDQPVPFFAALSDYNAPGFQDKWQAIARYSITKLGTGYSFTRVAYKEFVAGVVLVSTFTEDVSRTGNMPEHYYWEVLPDYSNVGLIASSSVSSSASFTLSVLGATDIPINCFFQDDVYTEKTFSHRSISASFTDTYTESHSEINHVPISYVYLNFTLQALTLSKDVERAANWSFLVDELPCHFSISESYHRSCSYAWDGSVDRSSVSANYLISHGGSSTHGWSVNSTFTQINTLQRYSKITPYKITTSLCNDTSSDKNFYSDYAVLNDLFSLPGSIALNFVATPFYQLPNVFDQYRPLEELSKSLATLGVGYPPVYEKNTSTIVDGNGTYQKKQLVFIEASLFKTFVDTIWVDRFKNHLLPSYSSRTPNPILTNLKVCSKNLDNLQTVPLDYPIYMNDLIGVI